MMSQYSDFMPRLVLVCSLGEHVARAVERCPQPLLSPLPIVFWQPANCRQHHLLPCLVTGTVVEEFPLVTGHVEGLLGWHAGSQPREQAYALTASHPSSVRTGDRVPKHYAMLDRSRLRFCDNEIKVAHSSNHST